MKNLINYYYGLFVKEIKKVNDNYIFKIDNKQYKFILFNENIENLKRIYFLLMKNNIHYHEILVNKDNEWITYYNRKPYILIRKNISNIGNIDINEIVSFDRPLYTIGKINWKKKWEEKIDYYEYQMSEVGFKYKKLRKYFNYYIGLCETSISLLNYASNSDVNFYIQHKKIFFKDGIDDFFDPTNIIEDSFVRDIAEYIKIYYIEGQIDLNMAFNIIGNLYLDYDSAILLFSRLLYPNYFFDIYDRIIKEEINEDKIINCIKKSEKIETLLKYTYKLFVRKYNIPIIEWLEY